MKQAITHGRTAIKYLTALSIAFPLAATAILGSTTQAKADASQPYSQAFLQDASFVIYNLEGGPTVAVDDNGYLAKWGINGGANGLTSEQVRRLSYSDALTIYHSRYWNAIDADDLPSDMQKVGFDDAVQFGPQTAEAMIAQANGSVPVLMQEADAKYQNLAYSDPGVYGSSLPIWKDRQIELAGFVSSGAAAAASAIPANMPDVIEHHSLKPEARVFEREITRPSAPEVRLGRLASEAAKAPISLSEPAAEIAETAAVTQSPEAPGLFWTWVLGYPFTYLFKSRKRKRKMSRNFRPDEVPVRLPEPWATPLQSNYNLYNQVLPEFTAQERAALRRVFGRRAVQATPQQFRIDYKDHSHVTVEPQCVSLCGEQGIEDSLKFALSWGKCVITSDDDDYKKAIAAVATRLYKTGALPANFKIEGLEGFLVAPATNGRSAPKRPTASASRRSWGPNYAAPVMA